jgi:aminoglycoside phosphotransferase (APT) family kinase protein
MIWVLGGPLSRKRENVQNGQDSETVSDKLISYLRAKFNNPTINYASPLTRLQGGYETFTYRFELDGAADELAGPLVLRLYPQFYGTRNAVWESTVQNVLVGEGFPVAQAYVVCTDMSILGGAFFIMDCLPGRLLAVAPQDSVPGLLGKTHAQLHDIDPAPLIKALETKGISQYEYRLASRLDWLRDKADKLPWIRQAVNWLADNRPPEPERLSVCHGDFHAFNILYADGKVTGVLDWPGFALADPAFDVANSIVIITIPGKHLAASMGDFSSVDWDLMVDMYLAAYRTIRSLDDAHLAYYRVRRCVKALVQGFDGQKAWQHPLIQRDLIRTILDITGIQIVIPG